MSNLDTIALVLQILATVITVATAVGTLGYWLARKFAEVEKRFIAIESRMENRFIAMESRFTIIENRIESLEKSILALAEATKSAQEFIIDFLVYEGSLKRESTSFAKAEISRIYAQFRTMKTLSEFTEEDLEEMGRLIEKDELTWEEAQKLKQLVTKAIKEYGHKFPALWKIYWYAELMAALAIKKEVEEKRKQKSQQ